MQLKSCALLFMVVFATGCGFPRVDFSYQGNGDEGVLEFMRGNYMSSEPGVAKYLQRHLEAGLQPGQVLDQAYLVRRGAICTDGVPVACSFKGVAKEHFSGLPKENAVRARRVTGIEARVVLASPVRIEVVKELTYPDLGKPE